MQQDGRRASSIGAGEPPPDYGRQPRCSPRVAICDRDQNPLFYGLNTPHGQRRPVWAAESSVDCDSRRVEDTYAVRAYVRYKGYKGHDGHNGHNGRKS
jgi:hypothetical protein